MISFVKAVKDLLVDASLTTDYTLQLYEWRDTGKDTPYIVIQPNGGQAMVADLGSEHNLRISLISSKSTGYKIEARAIEIIDYLLANSVQEWGYIESQGGISQPVFTTDNRMILRLDLRIIYNK
ncbi:MULTISPECIES: phage tail termination protein [Actinobacillus]|uniref:Phage protein n=1 Tax=Actinobacillus pleuropneumoniae serovar 6 str. Femo TaxID=754256 RepID=A0A828PMK3_ACTPL|nr:MULTISPECIES: hypothetical protein [Actinobacillus]EFL79793.1 hypothetical protein APP6_0816 [Actinobacillus pleuropneumoniae serovar 6 str. Femo]EFM92383.1 hypothetical protein appser6_5870 [Actinobacillus pleuropneumoniae serovar 6 str. Femo]EFN03428.1 hypothetical protein appser13_5030 [Actinobacillus pleuropneumoniae serovar 13 str. N273]KIE87660.1 hypothetical protein AP1022_02532 [Actinobacillus pleuropneumoniae]KIE92241.1 hypothetical protein AP518_00611 [Actinobacillus pleuropneumon